MPKISEQLRTAHIQERQTASNLIRLADRFKSAQALEVGKTIETPSIRAHRFRSSIRVTEMAGAGKRGKKVREFALYDIDYTKDKKVLSNVEKFAKGLHKSTFDQALKWAKLLVKDAENRGSYNPKIEETTKRGVDVTPAGHAPIKVQNKDMIARIEFDEFSIRDLTDRANEPTAISTGRTGKRGVKKFYAWARKNQDKLKTMNFRDVLDKLGELKVYYHYYLAMD